MDKKAKFELANWVIDFARKNGAREASVSLYNYMGSDITVRKQEIEKIQESIKSGLNIKLFVDGKYSTHSTNRLRKDDLKKFIAEAIASTKYLAEDKFRILPEPNLYYKGAGPDLKLYDDAYSKVAPKTKLDFVMQTEAETLKMDDRIIAVTCYYNDSLQSRVRMMSNGFEAYEESTSFSVSASAAVKDKDARPSDYDFVSSRFIHEIDTKGIGKNAVKRALKKIGQQKIESGKYPMLLENRVAERLIGALINAMYGPNLQQKNSFLEEMKGKKIASGKLSITDNPLIVSGSNSRLFDSEGIAARLMPVVEQGILKNYYIDTYYGKKLDMAPTTGYPSNLEFSYGNRNLDELIKSMSSGILVTGFNGGNSNTATGDFSYGIDGFLIKKGKMVKPVSEMVITGNHKAFWNQLAEIGNDPVKNRSWRTASMLFDDVDFSGL